MDWYEGADPESARTAALPVRVTRPQEPGKAFLEYGLLVGLVAIMALLTLATIGARLHDVLAMAAQAL